MDPLVRRKRGRDLENVRLGDVGEPRENEKGERGGATNGPAWAPPRAERFCGFVLWFLFFLVGRGWWGGGGGRKQKSKQNKT